VLNINILGDIVLEYKEIEPGIIEFCSQSYEEYRETITQLENEGYEILESHASPLTRRHFAQMMLTNDRKSNINIQELISNIVEKTSEEKNNSKLIEKEFDIKNEKRKVIVIRKRIKEKTIDDSIEDFSGIINQINEAELQNKIIFSKFLQEIENLKVTIINQQNINMRLIENIKKSLKYQPKKIDNTNIYYKSNLYIDEEEFEENNETINSNIGIRNLFYSDNSRIKDYE